MMRLLGNKHMQLMALHGTTMVGLGLALFYVRNAMTNLFFDCIGGVLASLLIVASLIFIALSDWWIVIELGSREVSRLRRLLTLSTIAAAGSLCMIFYPAATTQMLCYFIAAYALLLGIGKVYLALHWTGTLGTRLMMWALAVVALSLSGVLVAVAGKTERIAVTVLATYSLFTGLQMFLCIFFLLRMSRSAESYAERAMSRPKHA